MVGTVLFRWVEQRSSDGRNSTLPVIGNINIGNPEIAVVLI
ncbi:hypothetical protein AALM74_05725 [Parabacteroides segnis]